MTATVSNIINAMENLAPKSLAEKWDNPGLQVGHPLWPVKRIWIALDPTPAVVKEACQNQVDMLVTHHPLLFSPLRSLDISTPIGDTLQLALSEKLAVFSAHTNLDVVQNGVNDTLANTLGLKNIVWLDGHPGNVDQLDMRQPFGFGRMGQLDEEMSLKDLAEWVKSKLEINPVRVSGNPDLMISQVATCCGSGSGLMQAFLSCGAPVFISGDLKYHDARDTEALGLGLIDIGHFASEHLVLETLSKELHKELAKHNFDVIIEICKIEKDPFVYY